MVQRGVKPCKCIYNGTDSIEARNQAGAWEASLLPVALLLLPTITTMDSPRFCLITCVYNIEFSVAQGGPEGGVFITRLAVPSLLAAAGDAAVQELHGC